MRLVKKGVIEKKTLEKLLLARLDKGVPPKIGENVYTVDMRVIGKIVDIIGRVESPIAIIKPYRESFLRRALGEKIYVRSPHRARRKRRR